LTSCIPTLIKFVDKWCSAARELVGTDVCAVPHCNWGRARPTGWHGEYDLEASNSGATPIIVAEVEIGLRDIARGFADYVDADDVRSWLRITSCYLDTGIGNGIKDHRVPNTITIISVILCIRLARIVDVDRVRVPSDIAGMSLSQRSEQRHERDGKQVQSRALAHVAVRRAALQVRRNWVCPS